MIRMKGVSATYPDGTTAIEDLDLRISKGSFVTITGDNGSGKSTLIRLINGLYLPSKGEVTIDGRSTSSQDFESIRHRVSMVFQDPHTQLIGQTVEEDVAFGPENLGFERSRIRWNVDRSLGLTGMSGMQERSLSSLSGGQLQKTSIAGILAMEPEIFIFDEVTSMLDPVSRLQILSVVKELHKKGKTIINVTHHVEETLDCDRLIALGSGSIVHDGSPQEIYYDLYKKGMDIPSLCELAFRLCDDGILNINDILEPSFALNETTLKELLCQLK